jgi:NADH dehydrogenase
MEWMPGPPLMSRDNLDSMREDNIASGLLPGIDAPELEGPLGWRQTPIEQMAIDHLGSAHVRTRLDIFRSRAHR